jgi:hypothetical protein
VVTVALAVPGIALAIAWDEDWPLWLVIPFIIRVVVWVDWSKFQWSGESHTPP